MTINVLISTIDQGIEKIKDVLLPFRPDVKYIISHQFRHEKFLSIPLELIRDDVQISQIPGQGLTRSRNNAIKLATGEICVIADDDVKYTNEYFDTIIDTYKHNSIDVACFKICKVVGADDYKFYPPKACQIKSIHQHSASSIEITFNLRAITENNVFFDERFGLGSWLNGGGEILFINDAIAAGLNVWYFPEYIVKHPHECTITKFGKYHKRKIRVTGAMDMRLHGTIAFLKTLPRTIKLFPDLIKNRKNPITYLYQTFEGNIYILKNKNRNK